MTERSEGRFHGRDAELRRLDELLRHGSGPNRPVVITGMGGVGKTALVLHWLTSRFSEEDVEYVDLYRLTPAGHLTDHIASLLAGRSAPRKVLALDGAERFDPRELENAVRAIAARYPRLPVVIASRRPHVVSDETIVTLGGLTERESLRILLPEELPETDRPSASELARLLGGHPLSLAIARALIRDMPAAEVLRRLSGPLYDLREQAATEPESALELIQPQIILPTQRMVERLKSRPEDIYRLTPRQFEELVAHLLEDMGFVVQLTKATRDGGVDILAFTKTQLGPLLCLVQAKRYARDHPVGIEVVRNLYGTFCDREANSALLVTSSRFTEDARTFAKRHEYVLSLREYADLVRWLQQYGRRAS